MCFSASASFGAGAILSVIGVASIKKIQAPSQIIFASIPLLFAGQQLSEGILWLSLSYSAFAPLESFTTYLFLFFAQIVWPMYIPLGVLMLEDKKRNKKVLKILFGIGIIVSLYLAYCLCSFHVHAKIMGPHISYIQNYPEQFRRFGGVLYFMATILPPYFSSYKKMWVLSVAIFISYIFTYIFYEDYIISVWCFFASLISILVFWMMREIMIMQQKKLLLKD